MTVALDQLGAGEAAVVQEVHGGRGVRQRLAGFGLHPGDTVLVVRSGSFLGPVWIRINGSEVALGRGMARRVRVERSEGACG